MSSITSRQGPYIIYAIFCQIGGYTRHTIMKDGSYANIHQSYTLHISYKLTQHLVYQDEGNACNRHCTVMSTIRIRTHFSFDDTCVLFSRFLYSFQNSLLFSNSSAPFITWPNYQNVRGNFQNLGLRPLRRESLVFIVIVEIYAND